MKLTNRAIFAAAILILVFFENQVNSGILVNETRIVDEFGDTPSLIYEGGTVEIGCYYQPESNLVVNQTYFDRTGLSSYQGTKERIINTHLFRVPVNSKMDLGHYYCADYISSGIIKLGQTFWGSSVGNLSENKLDVFYRLCESCLECQRGCGKDFTFAYNYDYFQKRCTTLDWINVGNINVLDGFYNITTAMDVICVRGENVAQKSLFDALLNKKHPTFVASASNNNPSMSQKEMEKACHLKFEFADKNFNPISMGSAILYEHDTYLNLVCNQTNVTTCMDAKYELYIPESCGNPFAINQAYSNRIPSMVNKITCRGKSLVLNQSERHTFNVKTYIYVIHMDTTQYFYERPVVKNNKTMRELVCGFLYPPNDGRFTVTADLFFNGSQIKWGYENDAKFIVVKGVEFECRLVLRFKSCYMKAEFTKTVSMKLPRFTGDQPNQICNEKSSQIRNKGWSCFLAILSFFVFLVNFTG